jgi:hypothetical protein
MIWYILAGSTVLLAACGLLAHIYSNDKDPF